MKKLTEILSGTPSSRLLIVYDGTAWHVRHVALIQHDRDQDHKVYRCDRPISSDHATLGDALADRRVAALFPAEGGRP